jgi:cytochrome c-type biogenesis protein CcmF
MLQEFVRGASVRRRATGTDLFTALVGLFARSRRRYGGYVVHLGIVLIFLGIWGGTFERDVTVPVTPGQQFELDEYTVRFNALTVTEDSQKQMVTADVNVMKHGEPFVRMFPARWFFFGREGEPTTEVALRRGIAEDIYLVLAGYEVGQQEAHLLFRINPLINWIWFGVGLMVCGTIIAFLPERAIAFATRRVPEGAVTTSLILLLALGAAQARVHAQHVESASTVFVAPTSELEKELQDYLVCMCGTCGRQRIGECTCPVAAEMRAMLARLVAEGKSRDEIIQAFVAEWEGQHVLGAPIDEGFNRLAWLLPYGAGALGIALIGGVAVRWSRRREQAQEGVPAMAPTVRPELEDRLNDELRDLD